jgi:lysophospholipase L1-like esterase
MIKNRKYINYQKKKKYILICLVLLSLILTNRKLLILNKISYNESTYYTIWATAIHTTRPPPIKLDNNSLRQIFRISAGGEKVRIKLSNILGKSDLEVKKVCIADLVSESEINRKSMKYLTFNGKYNIIIKKGKEIYSDTIIYPLKAFSKIAISIYFGSVPKKLSGHGCSLTYSYIEKGNKIKKQKFSHENKVDHSYFISLIEISSDKPKKVIVCFGDSITDGVKLNNGTRDNYPDMLFEKIYNNNKNTDIAIVNEGINGDKLTKKGIERYQHDVLDIKGVRYIIALYGVNDLNILNATSKEIISGYKEIIKEAHKRKILIYSGTILPFSRFKYKYTWNKNKEKVRKECNDWIRKTKPKNGGFDGVFDFEKYIKDPKNETKMKDIYDCGDGIHPGFEGYVKMVELINDLNLFT